jgi:hypothetical protein
VLELALLPILLVKVHKDDVAVDYKFGWRVGRASEAVSGEQTLSTLVSKTTM